MIEHIHTFKNGRQHKITFTSTLPGIEQHMHQTFTKDMKRIEEIGLEATMQEWHNAEAKERRSLGLKVKERY